MQEFPKCLYLNGDVEDEFKIVFSPEEEEAMRFDGYADAGAPKPSDEVISLEEQAAALGVKVDKRWGVERLTAEIEKAKA